MRCEVWRVASFIFVMQPLGRRGVAVLLLSQPETVIGANLLIYLQKNKKLNWRENLQVQLKLQTTDFILFVVVFQVIYVYWIYSDV